VALVWVSQLVGFRFLKDMGPVSARSVPVLYAAVIAAAICTALWVAICRIKALWSRVVMLALVASILVSNQFSVAMVVQNGGEDDEFRQASAWYIQNAQTGEKLACSMFMVLAMIDEKNAGNFVPLPAFADGPGDPQKFLETCYKSNVTYVVWDSRLGLATNDRYHRLFGLNNITMLSQPKSVGPYEYVKTFTSGIDRRRYVHIFKLRKPPVMSPPASDQ
jgi:hypothetical protein